MNRSGENQFNRRYATRFAYLVFSVRLSPRLPSDAALRQLARACDALGPADFVELENGSSQRRELERNGLNCCERIAFHRQNARFSLCSLRALWFDCLGQVGE